MAIDITKIEDNAFYNIKEACDFVNIKSARHFYKIAKENKIESLKNGKFNVYKGSEIKKLIKKRLSK